MDARPLVSIITPTYNHQEFIAECIDSVLAQTYFEWEQIIIDDGSTDGTPRIISRYVDKRIKYIRQENQGIWWLGRGCLPQECAAQSQRIQADEPNSLAGEVVW